MSINEGVIRFAILDDEFYLDPNRLLLLALLNGVEDSSVTMFFGEENVAFEGDRLNKDEGDHWLLLPLMSLIEGTC